jgi:homoserine kinase type II
MRQRLLNCSAKSTVIDEVLARVLSHYGLGQPETVRLVEDGLVDDNWIVRTGRGRYFLKRHHPVRSDPDRLRAQHALVRRLRAAGFPAPNIRLTLSGDSLLILDGRAYELQDYIDGEAYDPGRSSHLEAAGATLAHYHTLLEGFAPPALCTLEALYTPVQLHLYLARLCESWQVEQDSDLASVARQLRLKADRLAVRFAGYEGLPYRVIHGDYWAGNLLFEGDRVVGVLDYDKAAWQPRLAELAEGLVYFSSSRPGHFQHLAYPGFLQWEPFGGFLRAYATVAGLSEAEILTLPDTICLLWFSVSIKRLWQGLRTRYSPGIEDRLQDQPPRRPAEALVALQEVLVLVDWATAHSRQMVEIAQSMVHE